MARARKLENDPAIVARLDELTLYVGYVDHYYRWQAGEIKFEDCMAYLWKADQTTDLFDRRKWVWKYLPTYHKCRRPAGHGNRIPDNWISRDSDMPDDKDRWKGTGKFAHAEIVNSTTKASPTTPSSAAWTTRPSSATTWCPVAAGSRTHSHRRTEQRPHLSLRNPDGTLPPIRIWGKTKWNLSRYDKTTHGYTEVESATTPPEETMSRINFKTSGDGLYGLNVACPASSRTRPWTGMTGRVPDHDGRPALPLARAGCQPVGVVPCTDRHEASGDLDGEPSGQGSRFERHSVFDGGRGSEVSDVVPIELPSGQDGKIWRIWGEHPGSYEMLNVPPYVAASPDELLKPRECGYSGP